MRVTVLVLSLCCAWEAHVTFGVPQKIEAQFSRKAVSEKVVTAVETVQGVELDDSVYGPGPAALTALTFSL